MYFYSQGKHTRQAHKGIPEGHFEEEQGRRGFYGPVSHLIRKKPSTRWKTIDGPLKPRMFDLVETKHDGKLQRLFYNTDITLNNLWLKPLDTKRPVAQRNADGDFIYFAHKGNGVVLTEYGLLKYRPGDYVMIQKCLPHLIVPSEESQFFVIENLAGDFREPDRGIAGRNAVYDQAQINPPDLEAQAEWLKEHDLKCTMVEAKHSGETTRFTYDDCIFSDVVGWKGDFFPFTLNMDQIMPLMSHRAHLPPSAHTTFVAPNFVVCSFVPRPLESDGDALRVPFYHQNIDYDEILFYHNGDFFSRQNLHASSVAVAGPSVQTILVRGTYVALTSMLRVRPSCARCRRSGNRMISESLRDRR